MPILLPALDRERKRQGGALPDDVGRHPRDVQPLRQGASDPPDDAHQGGGERPLHVEGQPAGAQPEDVGQTSGLATGLRRWSISRGE